jgi:hypothetical protein
MRGREGLSYHNVDPGEGVKGGTIQMSEFIATDGTVSTIVLLM